MKNQYFTAALAAFALTATAAVAAEKTQSPDTAQSSSNQWLVDTSKLDGTEVYDFHGNKLGELQQVLVDPESGRIRYGVLEVDKEWNWNDPMVAIPWGIFAVKKGEDKAPSLSIDATKEKLEKAPKFKVGDAERLYQKEASQPIYTYWGIYWIEDPSASDKSGGSSGKKQGKETKAGESGSGITEDASAESTSKGK